MGPNPASHLCFCVESRVGALTRVLMYLLSLAPLLLGTSSHKTFMACKAPNLNNAAFYRKSLLTLASEDSLIKKLQ